MVVYIQNILKWLDESKTKFYVQNWNYWPLRMDKSHLHSSTSSLFKKKNNNKHSTINTTSIILIR